VTIVQDFPGCRREHPQNRDGGLRVCLVPCEGKSFKYAGAELGEHLRSHRSASEPAGAFQTRREGIPTVVSSGLRFGTLLEGLEFCQSSWAVAGQPIQTGGWGVGSRTPNAAIPAVRTR
jgi:hypothetical protein